jgi:hypothetical protein
MKKFYYNFNLKFAPLQVLFFNSVYKLFSFSSSRLVNYLAKENCFKIILSANFPAFFLLNLYTTIKKTMISILETIIISLKLIRLGFIIPCGIQVSFLLQVIFIITTALLLSLKITLDSHPINLEIITFVFINKKIFYFFFILFTLLIVFYLFYCSLAIFCKSKDLVLLTLNRNKSFKSLDSFLKKFIIVKLEQISQNYKNESDQNFSSKNFLGSEEKNLKLKFGLIIIKLVYFFINIYFNMILLKLLFIALSHLYLMINFLFTNSFFTIADQTWSLDKLELFDLFLIIFFLIFVFTILELMVTKFRVRKDYNNFKFINIKLGMKKNKFFIQKISKIQSYLIRESVQKNKNPSELFSFFNLKLASLFFIKLIILLLLFLSYYNLILALSFYFYTLA